MSCAYSPVCNARPLELYMYVRELSLESGNARTVNIFHSKISSFFSSCTCAMVVLEHVKIVCSPRECECNVLVFNLMYMYVHVQCTCVCMYLISCHCVRVSVFICAVF